MKHLLAVAATIGAMALAGSARGSEADLRIADGPESALVRANCSSCHSLDYLQMNSPFLKRAGWESEVRKMMKVMGAPVPESEVTAIVDYLTRHYGVE